MALELKLPNIIINKHKYVSELFHTKPAYYLVSLLTDNSVGVS